MDSDNSVLRGFRGVIGVYDPSFPAIVRPGGRAVYFRGVSGPAKDLRAAIDLILGHLDRHGPNLCGHVIPIPEECGGGIRLVGRTNNILESWFGSLKRGERRRSGRKVLIQDFERLPASAALALNLTCPDYVSILCGSLTELPAAFAKLDAQNRQQPTSIDQTVATPETASLNTTYRRFVRMPELQQLVEAAVLGEWHEPAASCQMLESNRVLTL